MSSPSLTGFVTLTLNRMEKGSRGVPGVDGSDGGMLPLEAKSESGESCVNKKTNDIVQV